MGTYLDTIIAAHRAAAASDERSLDDLLTAVEGSPPPRGFGAALAASPTLRVIAEIKRRSPSKGALNPDLDPASVAADYERGGAACLSVLTDAEFFGGSPADLGAARAGCRLPVLRKDFTVDPRDVADARLMGADAVLLIVAALDDASLRSLLGLAADLALDALVEVHDERELDRAAAAGAAIIGVNQRDLSTFEIDRERAVKLAPRMPDGVTTVAESGIRGSEDARAIASAGYHAVLVGESVVTSGDPAAAVAALAEVPVACS
ncbi:MAG TPA: indole-3-glycerol phosphate synthase TrpC [Acidimicrobiales bacterium]|nr:indole-3-glycerol phosphate synthase TrpC [Acidimicrobiales bacterium]